MIRALNAAALVLFFAGCDLFLGDKPAPATPSRQGLASGQAADLVLGQPDFETNSPGTSASKWNSPWGNPTFAGGRLYVSDNTNKRVVVFNAFPTSSGAAANFALGVPDLTTVGGSTVGQGAFGYLFGVVSNGTQMAVIEGQLNRVDFYANLPTSGTALPDHVLGQSNWTTTTAGNPSTGLSIPNGAWLTSTKLLVADSGNNRVLIWNTVHPTDGMAADLVLGQTDLTTVTSGTTASQLSGPNDVWSDGTKVVVVDANNHRVLIWNTFPSTNGQAADLVLGQADFVSHSPGLSRTSFNNPQYLATDGQQLAVADYDNHRVLVWTAFPSQNAQPASLVLGQKDFVTNDAPNPPTARSMNHPGGLFLDAQRLVVADYGNNRVLVFQLP